MDLQIHKRHLIATTVCLLIGFTNTYCDAIDSLNSLLIKTSEASKLVKINDEIAHLLIAKNDSSAIRYSKEQYKLASNLKLRKEMADALNNLGRAYKLANIIDHSVDSYMKEIEIRNSINDIEGVANVYCELGEVYRSIFDHSTALEYLNKSYNLALEIRSNKIVAKSLNRIAAVYAQMDNYSHMQEAFDNAFKANLVAKEIKDIDLQVSNLLIMGTAQSAFSNFHESFDYLFEALRLIKSAHEQIHESLILKAIATTYYLKKDYTNAVYYGKQAYDNAQSNNVSIYKWLSAMSLYMSYEGLGKIDSAYKYFKIYYDERVNNFNEEKSLSLSQMNQKYQLLKYNQKIEEQEYNRKFQMLMYSIIVLLLIFLFLGLYLRFKNLKTKNILLNQKNEIINQQKEELHILNATKDKFFSIIAHDLKSPLGNFKQVTDLLANSYHELTESEKQEFLVMLNKSAHNIYALLENLLEWSRIQRSKLPFNPDEFYFDDIVNETIDLLNPVAQNKNISLSNNIPNKTKAFADANMIKTVVRNLISNSIKFTPENGKIEILIQSKSKYHEVTISDSGVGIPEEKLGDLFSLDVNVSTKGTAQETGTGLGLILCKEFINKNGGVIKVTSQIGIGSQFIFTIPIARI